MLKRDRKTELIAIASVLIFAVAMSLYHLSFSNFLGLSNKEWILVWAILENGLPISLCFVVSLNTEKLTKFMFKWLLPAYFFTRLLYHLSCYLNIFMVSKQGWDYIWSIELVTLFIIGLICCVIYMRTENE